jgi:hypothetical protein
VAIKRNTAIILALVLAAVLLLLALIPGGRQEGEGARSLDYYSAFSATPEGMKALFLFLKESGYDTRRLLLQPGTGEWRETNLIFMIEPVRPLTSDGVTALKRWVEDGGTLVASREIATMPQPWLDKRPPVQEPLYDEPPLPKDCTPDGSEWTECGKGSGAAAFAEGIRTLSLGRMGPSHNESIDGVRCLSYRSSQDPDRCFEAAVYGACKTLLTLKTVGKGSIIRLEMPEILLNRNIGLRDNLKLVLDILNRVHETLPERKSVRVGFDEYHRLLLEKKTSVWEVLGPGPKLAFYQLLFAIVLAAVGIARRFAPASLPLDEKVRTSLMQTETLSGILDRTGSHALALHIIHRHVSKLWKENAIRRTPRRQKLFETLENLYLKSRYMPGRGAECRKILRRYRSMLDELGRKEEHE